MKRKNNKIIFLFFSLFVLSFVNNAYALFLDDDEKQSQKLQTQDRAPRSDEEQRVINIYKKCKDAVVFINTLKISNDPFDVFMGVEKKQGSGSGVVIDSQNGIVLTNLHVIQNASDIVISFNENEKTNAKLLGADKQYDIAVLQMLKYPTNIASISLGNSASLEVGQKVMAIGNPFGLSKTLTSGIVSSLNRTVKSPQGYLMKGLIQTDASINPGNSGGPLIDMQGKIIGLNTAILSSSGDSAGIGFAVPANYLKRILPELIQTGKVSRPDLGVVLVDTSQGVMVQRVEKGSPLLGKVYPAESEIVNGYMRGFVRDFSKADIIFSINGKRVYNKEDLDDIVSKIGANKEMEIVVKRGSLYAESRTIHATAVMQ